MKLGSNRKSIGMGAGYREFSYDNKRIGFGFCKGDDNFGGQRRKELDDFTKSLGKQMNLVMKRMEETKKIRMRIRERQQAEEDERYQRKELEKTLQLERISKNQEWRERKKTSSQDDLGCGFNSKCIEWMIKSELKCCSCDQEMCPPLKIFQCKFGHSQCQHCCSQHSTKICQFCNGEIIGRNIAAENIASIIYSRSIILSSLSSLQL